MTEASTGSGPAGPPGPDDGGEGGRRDRIVAGLERWLAGIRGIPRVLYAVMWLSVGSGLLLAWWWFLIRDPLVVKLLAIPWLGLALIPQVGLWLLASSVRDLLELPDRLRLITAEVGSQGDALLRQIRGLDPDEGKVGFLRRLRDAYRLHGEVGKVVATRTVVHRLAGPLAAAIGPVAFLLNCAIVLVATIQMIVVLY